MSKEPEKIQVITFKDGTKQIEKLKQVHIICDKDCPKRQTCSLEDMPCLKDVDKKLAGNSNLIDK